MSGGQSAHSHAQLEQVESDRRAKTQSALESVERKLYLRDRGIQGQEMAGANVLIRRIDELQAIVSALRERVEVLSEWHLRLNDRLNELVRPAAVGVTNCESAEGSGGR